MMTDIWKIRQQLLMLKSQPWQAGIIDSKTTVTCYSQSDHGLHVEQGQSGHDLHVEEGQSAHGLHVEGQSAGGLHVEEGKLTTNFILISKSSCWEIFLTIFNKKGSLNLKALFMSMCRAERIHYNIIYTIIYYIIYYNTL